MAFALTITACPSARSRTTGLSGDTADSASWVGKPRTAGAGGSSTCSRASRGPAPTRPASRRPRRPPPSRRSRASSGAVQVDAQPRLAEGHEVSVALRKARDHGRAREVHDARGRSHVALDVGLAAHGHDPVAGDGHGGRAAAASHPLCGRPRCAARARLLGVSAASARGARAASSRAVLRIRGPLPIQPAGAGSRP